MTENNDLKILELDHPHGFLIWRGKQTALGTPESLPVGEKLLIVSEGEAFGYVTLKAPAQMKSSEFDREEYQKEHRLYPTEWRLDWPDVKTLNLYRFESWEPFDKALPFENGEIVADEPTPHEAALIDKSRYLPKTLILDNEAITMTGGKFTIADGLSVPDDLKQILQTTYETEVEFVGQKQTKYLPLYRLALVRVPNMRIKKKEIEASPPDSGAEVTSDGQVKVQQEIPAVAASVKQEDETMPWEKVRNHPDCSSDEPIAVVKTDTGEVEGCHPNEEAANRQLAALNASEAGESGKETGEKQVELEPLELKIEATNLVSKRFKRLLAMMAYNSSIGHSANFGMFVDGDGADYLKINDLDLSDHMDELKDFQARYNSIEMAGEDGYYDLPLQSRNKMKDLSAKQSSEKQESLQARLERIHQQFMEVFMMMSEDEDEYKDEHYMHDAWVVDVFDSFLIANVLGKLYRVNYMDTGDSVIFAPANDWVEVEIGYNPKGFALLAGDHKQFDESEWSGAASQWDTADAYCSDCLIDVNPSGEDKVKDLCFLPYRKPGSQRPNVNSLRTMASGRGISALRKPEDVSQDAWDSQLLRAANRLIRWWPEAFDKPAPDSIYRMAGKEPPSDERSWKDRLREAAKTITDFLSGAEYSSQQDDLVPEDEPEKMFNTESGFMVRAVNGHPWHFTWSTNAFRDRDGEIFTTKALERFVEENETKKHKGFFNFWHIEGTDFAEKEWQAVVGRFLVEAGPYLDNEAGIRAMDYFSKFSEGDPDVSPEGWGSSPEFRFLPEERAKDGIYHWLWITRTSTLPRAAAANINTEGLQIMAMTKQQEQAAIRVFGEDFVKQLKADGAKRTQKLEMDGVAYKGKELDKVELSEENNEKSPEESEEVTQTAQVEDEPEEDTPEEEAEESDEGGETVPVVEVNVEELAAEVKKQFEFDLQPVADAMAEILKEVKAVGDRVTKLEKQESVKQQVETPRFLLNLVRASQAEETALVDDDELKGKKPTEAKVNKDGTLMSSFFTPK